MKNYAACFLLSCFFVSPSVGYACPACDAMIGQSISAPAGPVASYEQGHMHGQGAVYVNTRHAGHHASRRGHAPAQAQGYMTSSCGDGACGQTGCGQTGCGQMGCGQMGCGQMGCGQTGCGQVGYAAAPGYAPAGYGAGPGYGPMGPGYGHTGPGYGPMGPGYGYMGPGYRYFRTKICRLVHTETGTTVNNCFYIYYSVPADKPDVVLRQSQRYTPRSAYGLGLPAPAAPRMLPPSPPVPFSQAGSVWSKSTLTSTRR